MKKMLILLAVAMFAATSVGCCCRRLCPWLDRGAACCPLTPAAAPLVATPAPVCCPPMAAPQYQYVTPLAAPMATPYAAPMAASPCAAPACTYWDPCQNAVLSQPAAGQPNYNQPVYASQPMMGPNMTSFAEPNCGYAMEPGCGEPFMGEMSYGPSFSSDCATCGPGGTGGAVSEGSFSAPAPESFPTDPAPVATE